MRRLALVAVAVVAPAGMHASVVGVAREALRQVDTRSEPVIRVLLGYADAIPPESADLGGTAVWNGRRYRGQLAFVPDAGRFAVINRLELEEYLRGVLPSELGSRDPRDRAAMQAQAVAARSYAAARMGERRALYDVTATVSDQVYGGLSVENPAADEAVRATVGLVLTWGDRIITAPYHSQGGEITAAADEVFWKRSGEPYLRAVDDRRPGGGCFCDVGGSREWERRFSLADLGELLAEHGRLAGAGATGAVRSVRIVSRGASGRVTALEIETSAGPAVLRGNDIRFVLRTRGALLPSTRFSFEMVGSQVVLRGTGNGHGVGMSQWGAIGRARAGQDARTILSAYYPGTRLAPLI